MLLGSRRHRDHASSRKDDYRSWNHESDSDRQRQPSGPSLRHDTDYGTSAGADRHHRSSKRADASNVPPLSSASAANRSASTRHLSNAAGNQAYATISQGQAAPAPPIASSSRTHVQDNTHGAYDMRAYLQRKADRRSPRSSEERLYPAEYGVSSRTTTKQPRTAYATAAIPSEGPASTQTYWIPPPVQSTHDPTSSSRHHRDRDRDREKETREQRRERKEREKIAEEQERMMSGRHVEVTRDRPRTAETLAEADRTRDQALERDKELERQIRHEERARRRAEREREKERERRREEKELDRARRHRETERAGSSRDRNRDEGLQYYATYPQAAPPQSSAQPSSKYRADDRTSVRQGPFLTDQIPSSSSNVALPATLHTHTARSGGVGEHAPQTIPPQVPEKERKRHRSHRERALLQQTGQDSGISSSEQELSGRERAAHRTERRRTTREPDSDPHPSGPSGSETERMMTRERRKASRTAAENHINDSSKSIDTKHQLASNPQVSGPVLTGAQSGAFVGSIRSQQLRPQLVSIRAGQGPADPQTPLLRTKTPTSTAQNRPREPQPASNQAQPSAAPPPSMQAYGTQTHNQPQTSLYPSQPYPAQQVYQRAAVATAMQDAPRAQASQPVTTAQLQQHTASLYPSQSTQSATNQRAPTYPGQTVQHPASLAVPQTNDSRSNYQSTAPQYPAAAADASYSRGYNAPASGQYLQPVAISKAGSGSSSKKALEAYPQNSSNNISQPPANVARLSVYHSPGLAVSADLILPVSVNSNQHDSHAQTGKPATRVPAQDPSSRFPLHEDMLTSASSSTLAPGTGRTVAGHLPGNGQRYTNEAAVILPSASGADPTRSSPYIPVLDGISGQLHAAMPMSPMKPPVQSLLIENDRPVPIPPPKATVTTSQDALGYQQSAQPPTRTYEPTSQSARPQLTPMQHRPAAMSTASAHAAAHVSLKHLAPQHTTQTVNPMFATGVPVTNHSPGRNASQHTLQRSPSIHLTPQLGSSTPKHSPSGRLVPRNGSTDTVSHIPAKNSPNDLSRSLMHRTSNASLRGPQPTARIETKHPRPQYTSEYPDPARYRSPAPTPYPIGTTQQHSNYNNPPPAASHHSRSASQPTNQLSVYDYQTAPQRGHSTSASLGVTPSPAAAPSASAIAAAYRSGLYNTDHPSRAQEPSQRVPPRSAPSPAPTARPQAPAPSLLSKTGFATTTASVQPVRGQTFPGANPRAPSVPTAPSHTRNLSDPQFARVAISGHPSTPAPPKVQLAFHPSPSEQELLKTPSSIARSVSKGSQLPPPSGRVTAQSIKGSKEKGARKRSIFDTIFRSRSSPPKEETAVSADVPVKPRQRSTSQTTLTSVAASVRNIMTPHPNPSRTQPPSRPAAPTPPAEPAPSTSLEERRRKHERPDVAARVPVPVVAEPPIHMPAPKMFTPFRLLSRSRRPLSDASVEAQDGTTTNTVIGGESARSSTAGRPSPPLRDPMEATSTWRNREEAEQIGRGSYRRRRPGVVFDVNDDFTETETHHPARKLGRR